MISQVSLDLIFSFMFFKYEMCWQCFVELSSHTHTHVSVRPYPPSAWGCLQVIRYKYTTDYRGLQYMKMSLEMQNAVFIRHFPDQHSVFQFVSVQEWPNERNLQQC